MEPGKVEENQLPDWIKPDPDAKEKGKLLFIERWAWKRSIKVKYVIIPMAFIWLITICMILLLGVQIIISSSMMNLLLAVICAILTTLVAMEATKTGMSLPFTIYENGITVRRVPFRKIIIRQEVFIPWELVNSVDIGSYPRASPKSWSILVGYGFRNIRIDGSRIRKLDRSEVQRTRDPRRGKTWVSGQHPDCMRVMRLMEQYVPDKLNGKAREYIRSLEDGPMEPGN